jgi:squalene-hopene/tetraprenyl-beta-curcumene cyclase
VFANACGIVRADEPAALPTSSSPVADAKVVATIGLGLTFLAKDAVAWREEHHCASCHHAALVVWSLQEAKQHGHAVDEAVLAEMTQWIADSGDGTTSLPRPEGIPKAFNEKAVSYALGLASVAAPNDASRAGAKRLLQTVKNDQLENGSWASWPETRPPLFGHSDERATLSAVLALLPAANAGEETAVAARDRGVQWLESTKSDGDPQSVALRIVLWQKLGRPAAELAPLVQIVKDRQKTDGGWSQSPEMPSDAWATGQALYALAHAGIKSEDAAVQRAQAYLAATQREDGSWPMTSRPAKLGDKPATNLTPITGAGSVWAVMGLVRSR